MPEKIEIRIDDVLINKNLTPPMVISLRKAPFFEQFKEFDAFFDKHNITCILAVVADGIDVYPEWVEYIKKNKHRYHIELHGLNHYNYTGIDAEQGYRDLLEGKRKIEEAFGVKVTKWYVPFMRKGMPEWGKEVCGRLGIGLNNAIDGTKRHYRGHYWNPKDVKRLTGIMTHYYGLEH